MCRTALARAQFGFGSTHKLGFASLISDFAAPLPFQPSPLSSSRPKQLAGCSSVRVDTGVSGFTLDSLAFSGGLVSSIAFAISSYLESDF
jgi:hypothetical protein